MTDTVTCLCCRKGLDSVEHEVPGWCDECVEHHPITRRYIAWGYVNHLDSEAVASLVFRKLTAMWN